MNDPGSKFPLRQLPKRAEIDVHVSAPVRWASKGVNGRDGSRVVLRTYRVGGRTFTTLADFEEFNRRLEAEPGDERPEPSERRRREIERAEAALSAMGV